MATLEELKQWLALLGIGGILGGLLTIWVRAILSERIAERRRRREDEKQTREKQIDTDRSTYSQRITILIRANLAAYIHSGKWFSDQDDLERLITGLDQGTYEHFLDPVVDDLWQALVQKSVELARRRKAVGLDEEEIRDYNRIRTEWEAAAKRSFGPLPATPEITPRRPHRRPHERGAA